MKYTIGDISTSCATTIDFCCEPLSYYLGGQVNYELLPGYRIASGSAPVYIIFQNIAGFCESELRYCQFCGAKIEVNSNDLDNQNNK